MASEEHKTLANLIKLTHQDLRVEYRRKGESAWSKHLEKTEVLEKYSQAMKDLAENHWTKKSDSQNRISWTVTFALDYFKNHLQRLREKETRILHQELEEHPEIPEAVPLERRMGAEKARLLDVGSCFNPFQKYKEHFEVTAVDIAPCKDSGVFKMDFLNARISDSEEMQSCHGRLRNLPRNYFDVVVFSLLLEYLPTSQQRIQCVRKALDVLDNEGILVVITPDSKHVGANAKLMKNWRYTLALMGFNRIKFEKLEHVTCMAFRKAVHPMVTQRWARLHKEPYMTEEISIPQDFGDDDDFLESVDQACTMREYCDLRSTFSELPGGV